MNLRMEKCAKREGVQKQNYGTGGQEDRRTAGLVDRQAASLKLTSARHLSFPASFCPAFSIFSSALPLPPSHPPSHPHPHSRPRPHPPAAARHRLP